MNREIITVITVTVIVMAVLCALAVAFYLDDFNVIASYDGSALLQNRSGEVFEIFDDQYKVHDRVVAVMYSGFTESPHDDVVVRVLGGRETMITILAILFTIGLAKFFDLDYEVYY